ncbi:hypothetical protein PC121_g22966 [Phytophthora cactorum]|nr:hypothetical protein PC120_g25049 [Phytophthora cactorum]KAG3042770.1 hypothetical protein PC121_g22966 [Phytophthora cactorum]KAG4038905.1 hypothetical protein PC123_g25538 [Phytophthora cactorum]
MPKRDSNNGEMETASTHIYELPHGQNGQWTRAQAAVHSRCGTPAKICYWRVLSGCHRIDRAGVPSAVAAPRLTLSRVEVDHLGQRGANVEPEEAAAVRRLGVQDVQVKAVQLPAARDDEPRHARVTE